MVKGPKTIARMRETRRSPLASGTLQGGEDVTPMKGARYLVENNTSVPAPFILGCGPERTMSYS